MRLSRHTNRTLAQRLFLCLLMVATVFSAQAAEETSSADTKRTPARMLPAAMAGILLSEGREQTEQPEKILDAMKLEDGDLVVDLGCGNGFYTLRLAPRVGPHGHVLAVDVQQGMLDQMQVRQREAGLSNIYSILGDFEDPYLPPGKADWILLVDVYHEFGNPEAMLKRIREALAPDGRVALLEYRAEEDQDPEVMPKMIPRDHKMTVDEVMSEWIPAGFKLVERLEFLPAQHYFIFKKTKRVR